MKSRALLLLLLCIAMLKSIIPSIHQGIPVTHDGQGHVARMANYAVAVRQGQFPPRFAPTFHDGYGYPVFNFHYPLLSLGGAPLVILGLNPEVVTNLLIIVCWVLLWLGLYRYIYQLTKDTHAALVGLLVLVLSPYLYTLVYVRGSYGELFAMTACFWLLTYIERQRVSKLSLENQKFFSIMRVVSGAILLLAHNIYALILFPLTLLYALWRRKNLSVFQVLTEYFLSFALSAFFWIPALVEKKYIVLDEKFSNFYLDHFLSLPQLLELQVRFGISGGGKTDSLTYGLGIAALFVLAFGITFIIRNHLKKQPTNPVIPALFVLIFIALFFMLPASIPIWKTFPLLQYLQFPWRILGPLSVLIAILSAYLFMYAQKKEKIVCITILCVASLQMFRWYYPTYIHETREYYLNYRESTTLRDELRTKTFTVPAGMLSTQQPMIIGNGTVTLEKWRGTYRTYTVHATESVTVVEPTMYFVGWNVFANGRKIPINTDPAYQGQVAYSLPAGEWKIESRMTQNTSDRLIGNTLSILSLLYIVVQLLLFVKERLGNKHVG